MSGEVSLTGKMAELLRTCQQKCRLLSWMGQVRDGRGEKVRIPASTVAMEGVMSAWLGITSNLALDQWAREKEARELFSVRRRNAVSSDTTVERSMEKMELGTIRKILEVTYRSANATGKARDREGPLAGLRAVAVDGTVYGPHWAVNAMSVMGVPQWLELELSAPGKELEGAREIVQRLALQYGRGHFDLVLGDALYMVQEDFRRVWEWMGAHLLVKTEEERLQLVREVREVVSSGRTEGVERVEGIDRQRGVRYRIGKVNGMRWEDLRYPIQGAWVEEEDLRTGAKREPFFVFTTAQLSCEAMREAAHRRWVIENIGHKRLNDVLWSKHARTKDPHAFQAWTLLFFIGMNVLELFWALLHHATFEQIGALAWIKKTMGWLNRRLASSVQDAPPLQHYLRFTFAD